MSRPRPPPAERRRPPAGRAGRAWPERSRIVVLVSGRGTNLQSLVDAGCPIAEVLSNVPGAPALARARAAGIPSRALDHRSYRTRDEFDADLAERIDGPGRADLVVLAGFMRILGAAFTRRFAGRLINIHPSLLPAFPGLRTHERALAAGVTEHGCTVHFVTGALDAGPLIDQARVPVRGDDTPASLAARVLAEEHRLLPRTVHRLVTGRIRLRGGEVRLDGHPVRPEPDSGPARGPPPARLRAEVPPAATATAAERGGRPPAARRRGSRAGC